jgi:hypothetical protein
VLSNPYVTLPLLAVGLAAVYAGSCWWFPFARCLSCEGSGRRARKDGKVWRPCRRCKGSGRRMRVGRWIYNYFAAARAGDKD